MTSVDTPSDTASSGQFEASSISTTEEPFPLRNTMLYSLGNAAGLITYNVFNTFITFFYADVVRLPANWVGRGWLIFGFWNAINDPIAGWLSDRTQSRFGRRRFYIRALAIPVALTFALIWLPPINVEQHGATGVMIYFLIIISIYDILQSIITLNQDALFPELYQGIQSRAKAATVRQMIGFLGGGIAVVMSPLIFERFGWGAVAALWGMISASLHMLSLTGIHEHPTAPLNENENPYSIRSQTQLVLENKIFHIVIGMNFVTRFILAILTASLPFYAKYVLNIPENQQSQLLFALLAAATISLIFWQQVFRRLGTRRTLRLSLIMAAIFAAPLLFVDDLTVMVIVLGFLGFVFGGTFLGPDLLFAELIDEDYVRTGVRREGIYRGLLGFVYRFPPALAGFFLLELLASAGYNADLAVEEQPEAVATLLRTFTVMGATIAVLAGIVLLRYYPLYGERLLEIQRKVVEMQRHIKDAE